MRKNRLIALEKALNMEINYAGVVIVDMDEEPLTNEEIKALEAKGKVVICISSINNESPAIQE